MSLQCCLRMELQRVNIVNGVPKLRRTKIVLSWNTRQEDFTEGLNEIKEV